MLPLLGGIHHGLQNVSQQRQQATIFSLLHGGVLRAATYTVSVKVLDVMNKAKKWFPLAAAIPAPDAAPRTSMLRASATAALSIDGMRDVMP